MGSAHQESCVTGFHASLAAVPPLCLREPLAALLGALDGEPCLEYSLVDAVKMAGHACPSVTGAWLVCQEALAALYPEGELPVRGEIGVTVYGAPGEAAYGVMAQVISLITGAAPATGFKGLGGKFARKDLLLFSDDKPDASASSFAFRRLDNGRRVIVRFFPWAIPFPTEKSQRLAGLMERVLASDASEAEAAEFRELWMEKLTCMLTSKDRTPWLKIAEG